MAWYWIALIALGCGFVLGCAFTLIAMRPILNAIPTRIFN